MSTADLPALNAVLNSVSTVLILSGLLAIRSGRKQLHAGCMIAALITSTAFLAGYLVHKACHGTTTSGHMGSFRPVYLAILTSHTILAMANLPLVIITVAAAARRSWARHRRWAAWTLPIWLYVSVTGVVVYGILYHWYPAPLPP